jgi:Xaa-Pro aminopeptidase
LPAFFIAEKIMASRVPSAELENRMARFRARMEAACPEWEMVALFSKINHYYFTGTMQEGVLLIPRDDEAVYWVRKSYQRAMDESLFPDIREMGSFRDAAQVMGKLPATVYLETEKVPLALYQRFQKHFPFSEVRSVDPQVSAVRAIKSPYELALMERSGKVHRRILEECVPELLREGMSEAEFAAEMYPVMMAEGHHGVARFGMFETEAAVGLFCFGESSLYPTSFDGPGGSYGLGAAVPLLGSRERRLAKGDLVFVDFACGVEGYHTDKTMTYLFGGSPAAEVRAIHEQCVAIERQVADLLRPGAVPSQIYNTVMDGLSSDFLSNFMGFGIRQARFLGHGIGLLVDELPVIAKGFDEPMVENMVFAVEPKKGIEKVGMVGSENTFVVTKDGGRSITGNHPGLMAVY